MTVLVGRFYNAESLTALKDFINQFNCKTICVEERFSNVDVSYVSLLYSLRFIYL
jgi:hypothetical protein